MPIIDRAKLIDEATFYLGEANILDYNQMLANAERIISQVGDDDINYSEVLCKTLEASATQNKIMSTIDLGRGVKREKSDHREVEFFSGSPSEFWGDYLKALPQLCETFGYCCLSSKYIGGFKSNVSPQVRVPAGSAVYGSVEDEAAPSGRPITKPYIQ